MAVLQDIFQQSLIPVGCFHKNLRFIALGRGPFHIPEGFDPGMGLYRQVTMKPEVLTIQSGGHQGQDDG